MTEDHTVVILMDHLWRSRHGTSQYVSKLISLSSVKIILKLLNGKYVEFGLDRAHVCHSSSLFCVVSHGLLNSNTWTGNNKFDVTNMRPT